MVNAALVGVAKAPMISEEVLLLKVVEFTNVQVTG